MRTESKRIRKEELNAPSIKTKCLIESNSKGEAECMRAITYGVTEEIYSFDGNSRKAYGIAVYSDSETDGTATVLASFNDITSDKDKLEELVQKCNRFALSMTHLNDVIDDFLAN